MYTFARPQRYPEDASLTPVSQESVPRNGHSMYASMQEQSNPPGPVSDDISIALSVAGIDINHSPFLQITSNNLSALEGTLHMTCTPQYSQSTHGSPVNMNVDRLGSTIPQAREHPLLLSPYYYQYPGLGVNTGTHLHNLAHISCHLCPYTPSGDTAYTWQGDGARYRELKETCWRGLQRGRQGVGQ